MRKQVRPEVLGLQRAIELGDQGSKAKAIAELAALESASRELSRESGIVRCMRIFAAHSRSHARLTGAGGLKDEGGPHDEWDCAVM